MINFKTQGPIDIILKPPLGTDKLFINSFKEEDEEVFEESRITDTPSYLVFKEVEFSDAAIAELVKCMQEPWVQECHFPKCLITPEQLTALNLEQVKSKIKVIGITQLKTEENALSLSEFLTNHQSLRRLDIQDSQIDIIGAITLVDHLAEKKEFEEIRFVNCTFSPEACEYFGTNPFRVNKIGLSNIQLLNDQNSVPSDLEEWKPFLGSFPYQLKTISLSNNPKVNLFTMGSLFKEDNVKELILKEKYDTAIFILNIVNKLKNLQSVVLKNCESSSDRVGAIAQILAPRYPKRQLSLTYQEEAGPKRIKFSTSGGKVITEYKVKDDDVELDEEAPEFVSASNEDQMISDSLIQKIEQAAEVTQELLDEVKASSNPGLGLLALWRKMGYEKGEALGDGSCLFHSIVELFNAEGNSYWNSKALREATVNHMRFNFKNIVNEYLEIPWEEYLDKMELKETYAGHPELVVMADHLRREIRVIDHVNPGKVENGQLIVPGALCFLPLEKNRSEFFRNQTPLYVYLEGRHYSPMLPKTSSSSSSHEDEPSAKRARWS